MGYKDLRKRAFIRFDAEIAFYPELYLSTTYDVNLTALAEDFINHHDNLPVENYDQIYDFAVEWLDEQVAKGNVDPETLKWVKINQI